MRLDPIGLVECTGVSDEAAELLLAETIVEEDLLFLAELRAELGQLPFLRLPVLAGWVISFA